MPSSISHAMIAVAAGAVLAPRSQLRSCLIAASVCAVIPDIDAIGRLLPVDDGDIESLGGHRGFTHSLTFAALAGGVGALTTVRSRAWDGFRTRLMALLTMATAAHGMLDALTSVGAATSPVQFFSPFSSRGYASPSPPIRGPFGELFLCVLPSAAIAYLAWRTRELPWRKRLPDRPSTLSGNQPDSLSSSTRRVRIAVYLLLVTLLAFWGWRAEMGPR